MLGITHFFIGSLQKLSLSDSYPPARRTSFLTQAGKSKKKIAKMAVVLEENKRSADEVMRANKASKEQVAAVAVLHDQANTKVVLLEEYEALLLEKKKLEHAADVLQVDSDRMFTKLKKACGLVLSSEKSQILLAEQQLVLELKRQHLTESDYLQQKKALDQKLKALQMERVHLQDAVNNYHTRIQISLKDQGLLQNALADNKTERTQVLELLEPVVMKIM